MLKRGQDDEFASTWQFLSSIILSAFTLEAYLNHVGDAEIPNWKYLERSLSPEAKIRHLCLALNLNIGGDGERPLQTVKGLIKFRNTLAHGRSETLEPAPDLVKVDDDLDGHIRKRPLTMWEQRIATPDFALRVHEDLNKLFKLIHEARPDPKGTLFQMGFHSSWGSLEEE